MPGRSRYAPKVCADGARHVLIVTDGVFSMDGYIADLAGIYEVADRYDALVMVDDRHATGFIGPGGRNPGAARHSQRSSRSSDETRDGRLSAAPVRSEPLSQN